MNARKPLILSTKNYNGVAEFTEFDSEDDLREKISTDGRFELGTKQGYKPGHETTSLLLSAEELPIPPELVEIGKKIDEADAAARAQQSSKWKERVKKNREDDRKNLLTLFQVETINLPECTDD